MASLEVEIGSDIKGLIKGLDKAQKELKETGKVSIQAGKDIASVGGTAAKGVNKLQKSTTNAVPAMQEFSRVIQDAPYGIQGVANNITQLTSQFGYLTKSAGGTKNALKAMLGTLTGPAGILLVISAVTTLLVSFGDELLALAGSTDKLAEATKEYLGEAKAEVTALETLVKIATDEKNSKQERLGAINEINEKYGKYLGNLDEESIKTDAVTRSIDNLTKSLILKAKIQGLESLIAEKSTEAAKDIAAADLAQVEAKKRLVSEIDKVIKQNSFLNTTLGNVKDEDERIKKFIELANKYSEVRTSSSGAVIALSDYNKATKESKEANNELDKSLENLINTQEKLKRKQFTLESGIKDVDEGAVVIKAKVKLDKKAKVKDYSKILRNIENDIFAEGLQAQDDFIKQWEDYEIDVDPFDGMYLNIQDGYNKIIAHSARVKEVLNEFKEFDLTPESLESLNLEQLDALSEKLKNIQTVSMTTQEIVGAAFSALSTSIVDSVSTGNKMVDALVSAVITSLLKMLSQMATTAIAEKAIATGKIATNTAVATSAAIAGGAESGASTGPGAVVAIPTMIAALVGIVGAAFASIGSFATGSGGFSGDNNLAFLNRNEMILRPMEQSALYNAIRGHNLGSLAESTNSSDDGGIFGETILRGDKQVIQYRRGSKKMSRYFNS